MTYQCPYCGWQMHEPSPAEYEDSWLGEDAYEDAMGEFEWEQRNHDCSQIGDLVRSGWIKPKGE